MTETAAFDPADADVAVLSGEQVTAAVTLEEAIAATRAAFVSHHLGEWVMPPKVYLPRPPHGDFRAMPAANDDVAMVKWVTSFPGNAGSGVPVVSGVVCLNDATTGRPLMLVDAKAATALRTGASAAVATAALAAGGARTAGIVGCGVHGSWTARALAASGFEDGVCADPDATRAAALAAELGGAWRAGEMAAALACDVISCVTPGHEPVVDAGTLRPGQHLNMLGADGPRRRRPSQPSCGAGSSATRGSRRHTEERSPPPSRRAPSPAATSSISGPPSQASAPYARPRTTSPCSTRPASPSRTSPSGCSCSTGGGPVTSTRRSCACDTCGVGGGKDGAVTALEVDDDAR